MAIEAIGGFILRMYSRGQRERRQSLRRGLPRECAGSKESRIGFRSLIASSQRIPVAAVQYVNVFVRSLPLAMLTVLISILI